MTGTVPFRPPGDVELLRQAVEGMTRALFVLDDQLRFRYLNPAAHATLGGRHPGDLLGRHIWDEFPHGVGSVYDRAYRHAAATGEKVTFEAWVERLDGWFRVDVFGTRAGLVVTYEDVSLLHRVERSRDDAVAARIAEAQRAEAAARTAERAGRHLMLLGDVSRTFTVQPEVHEAVTQVAELCVPLLGDWCLTALFEDGRLQDVGRAHRDPALLPYVQDYAEARERASNGVPVVPPELHTGAALVVQDLTPEQVAGMSPDPASRAALVPLRPSAVAVFPFVVRDELVGLVTLVTDTDRGRFTDEELRTAEIVARRVAERVENARLVATRTRMTEQLQRGLLTEPVQGGAVQIAVRHRAARSQPLGGDWYDSFRQPDGDTVLVIGEVVGRDQEAAAAMGQVRTLLRGTGWDRGEEPARLLARTDRTVVGLAVPTVATALVARVEGTAPHLSLHWASAGHGGPLLALPDGTVQDLTGPVTPPLGTGWTGERTGARADLPAGCTLLLCTDGLVERADRSPEEGRASLATVLGQLAGLPVEELCDALLHRLPDDGADRDVAVLAVRVGG
ncbi:SpoIIE family protein phosphatase [Modestobacter sp. I12A-02628]|uniref:SpoIIE family protein phosphatase n=1 Tax=Goekera deserti TaxID=2497753 RepID=A0A7K3WL40_9ACTN|nr:SpoIIE family protein phosphatase [Goekera deserti]MPR00558.1 SpoIIE family protein phosphatase [Goekera deserti]NDI50494.1 SpoIIE family protein phosphatase [Goekera deserti]NEL56589.1 SpoIIE family protein phosphatase [Goekera deserti]